MSTAFFQQQATARRKTLRLLVLFAMAVVVVVVLIYVLCLVLFVSVDKPEKEPLRLWHPWIFLGVTATVSLILLIASLFKLAELSSGGKAVALALGGVEVPSDTHDLRQRRLLNVVEEMALASGVPVPVVFLLPQEKGINAFAAGYGPGDAVVAVSEGCLEYLSRDELQGVVAHEFSHLLNGDMHLNLRLIAILAGLLVLSQIGWMIMRVASQSSSSSSSKKNDGGAQLVLLGLGLYILGLIGLVLGNLIKAAVSRQREFLADASAVQFTRYPPGIGGALKKIGGLSKGPNLDTPRAPEASHMFFADALTTQRFSQSFATHPPLQKRIRAIDPQWDGAYPEVQPVAADPSEAAGPKKGKVPPLIPGLPTLPGMGQLPIPVVLAAADSGAPEAPLPDPLQAAAHEPFSARSLVYALLLDRQASGRQAQLNYLREHCEPAEYRETLRLLPLVEALAEETRLPLLDLLLPALRKMSTPQYLTFRSRVEGLVTVDQQLSLFEYCLVCVLSRCLGAAYGQRPAPQVRYRSVAALEPFVVQVLALVAWEGDDNPEKAQAAFRAGLAVFRGEPAGNVALPRRGECTLRHFHAALVRCEHSTPALKERVVQSCAACILADRQVIPREAELFRAICAVLGVPIPPVRVEDRPAA
jgi:Zn-dependent protease with chaperone function